MLVAAPKPDKRERFNAALAETSGEPLTEATTPRKRAAKKAADPPEPTDSAEAATSAADRGTGRRTRWRLRPAAEDTAAGS